MRLKNPFDRAWPEHVAKSHLRDRSMQPWHYHHLDIPTINVDETMMHLQMHLPLIIWNTRLGIYESPDPIYPSNPLLEPIAHCVLVLTAIWSLCELPLELFVSPTALESAAAIIGKLIWLALIL